MPDNPTIQPKPYAAAVRKLLTGVVYTDDSYWSQLRDYELPVREYLGDIGLGLHLDEIGGFAYLYETTRDDESGVTLPALTQRRALSFPQTLLLVLLRERLDEHEMRDVDGDKLYLTLEEMTEMLTVFMGDHPDARRLEQTVSSSIKRLARYGYLKERKNERYEVRPVLRAKVDADTLEAIKAKLTRYTGTDNEDDEETGDE